MRSNLPSSRITALLLAVALLLSVATVPVFAEAGLEELFSVTQEEGFGGLEKRVGENTDHLEGAGQVLDGGQEGADSVSAAMPTELGTGFIVAFEPLAPGVSRQEVVTGTALAGLNLPDTLMAAVKDGEVVQARANVPVAQWISLPDYNPMVIGAYTFIPELAAGYTLGDGVALPEINVDVFMGIAPMAAPVTITSYGELADQLLIYKTAGDDMVIILDQGFPTDTITIAGSHFEVPQNPQGYTLTIRSKERGSPKVIQRGQWQTDPLFVVLSGGHLVLQDVILDGNKDGMYPGIEPDQPLVQVNGGGKLTMLKGAVLRNNKNTKSGGGVAVGNGGEFTMKGGEIHGNSANFGGGVLISGDNGFNSVFTMEGGEIYGNVANSHGGGVWCSFNTTFTMEDGAISGNSAANNGGGVYLTGNKVTFTINGGEISGNSATDRKNSGAFNVQGGGGVLVNGGSAFIMAGGKITDNKIIPIPSGGIYTYCSGGGVRVTSNSTFTMKDGEISGNVATSVGGGVYVFDHSAFTMEDGEITGNSARTGGGAHINNTSTFTMEGGEISNNLAGLINGGVYVEGKLYVKGKPVFVQNGIYTEGALADTIEISGGLDSGGAILIEGSGWQGQMASGMTVAQKTSGPLTDNEAAVFQSLDGVFYGAASGSRVVWDTNYYTITATAGNGGRISPSGDTYVTLGSSQAFSIQANTGYEVLGVFVDGVDAGPRSSYTFSNITGNHTIHATFKTSSNGNNPSDGNSGGSNSYTVSYNANGGGGKAPDGAYVEDGGTYTIAQPTSLTAPQAGNSRSGILTAPAEA